MSSPFYPMPRAVLKIRGSGGTTSKLKHCEHDFLKPYGLCTYMLVHVCISMYMCVYTILLEILEHPVSFLVVARNGTRAHTTVFCFSLLSLALRLNMAQ